MGDLDLLGIVGTGPGRLGGRLGWAHRARGSSDTRAHDGETNEIATAYRLLWHNTGSHHACA